jgi:hypothetical protein
MRAFDIKDSMIFDTLKMGSLNKNATGTLTGKTGTNNEVLFKNPSAEDMFKSAFLSSKKK